MDTANTFGNAPRYSSLRKVELCHALEREYEWISTEIELLSQSLRHNLRQFNDMSPGGSTSVSGRLHVGIRAALRLAPGGSPGGSPSYLKVPRITPLAIFRDCQSSPFPPGSVLTTAGFLVTPRLRCFSTGSVYTTAGFGDSPSPLISLPARYKTTTVFYFIQLNS